MNINWLLQKPAEELTAKEKKALDFHMNARIAKDKDGERYWTDRIRRLFGIDTSRSRKARMVVSHTTNRHEQRAEAAKKRKGIEQKNNDEKRG